MRTKLHRYLLVAALAACTTTGDEPEPTVGAAERAALVTATREHVAGDVYHYTYAVRVGSTANATIGVHRVVRERAPWKPRKSPHAIMFTHGDFASFTTNFALDGGGLAPWLAARDVDVWGFDRRWARVARDAADLSDFDGMDLAQSVSDLGIALTFARASRLVGEGSAERLTLSGFSRGGELAYFYAAREATRPPGLRHVKALAPIDVYVSLAPEDEEQRQLFCASASFEYADLAAGFADSPNGFQIRTGQLAASAPDDPSPFAFFPGFSNREVLLFFVGQTYVFFNPQPAYHLLAPQLDGDGNAVALRETAEARAADWLARAPFHQALREAADTDALTCGETPLAADYRLDRITVPLYLMGAAGGYGERAVFSTTQVGSTDVTVHIVQERPDAEIAEDYGHGDLLYAPGAAALAWTPFLAWLRQH